MKKNKKAKTKFNKYQIAMRVIVIAALVFFTTISFALELLWNGI